MINGVLEGFRRAFTRPCVISRCPQEEFMGLLRFLLAAVEQVAPQWGSNRF